MRCTLLSLTLLLALACDGPTAPPATDAGPADAGASLPRTLGPEARPAGLFVPPSYDGTPHAVVFLLHGYGAAAAIQDPYFGLSRLARTEGFFVVLPDGTIDASNRRFWNATPACCDFSGGDVDDSGYLIGLLDELEAVANIDPARVYFMGHSNGGFMSYRMACEHSGRVAAIASLAGSDVATETDCVPSQPVSVLQIHGTLDTTISYDGGPQGAFPSAPDAVTRWATRAGCATEGTPGETFDFDTSVAGAETGTLSFEDGCEVGSALWTMEGSGHIPPLNSDFTPAVWAWLQAHAR